MKRLLLVVIFLLISVTVFALGSRENDNPVVQVTGVVRLTGTSLFPDLLISGSEHVWHIAADEIDKLIEMQHRTVTLEGEETVTELRFANGMYAGTRRELKNIRIISVD